MRGATLRRGVPYSDKADMWSLGVLAYEMMSQRLPFNAASMSQLGNAVCHKAGAYPYTRPLLSST